MWAMAIHEWDPAPPSTKQRHWAGIFLALFGLANASLYFGWRLFGGYDKQATGFLLIGGVIMVTYFMPSTRRR